MNTVSRQVLRSLMDNKLIIIIAVDIGFSRTTILIEVANIYNIAISRDIDTLGVSEVVVCD